MDGKRYTLDERYFLVGNNCTVGNVYKDILQKPYETPFIWNWLSYDDFTRLTLFWKDIDWKRQDFTPTMMKGDELRQRCNFLLCSQNDNWWTVRLRARSGEEFFPVYPHLQDGNGGGLQQMQRRHARMVEALEHGRKPLFILARDCTESGFNERQLGVAAANERIVLCDYSGDLVITKQIAWDVALPNLIERGFIIEKR